MDRELVEELAGSELGELLFMDGYDDCILGICIRFGREPIIAYDLGKVLASLQAQGMTHEEAVEWWEFNQVGAWVGERTPCFVRAVDTEGEESV